VFCDHLDRAQRTIVVGLEPFQETVLAEPVATDGPAVLEVLLPPGHPMIHRVGFEADAAAILVACPAAGQAHRVEDEIDRNVRVEWNSSLSVSLPLLLWRRTSATIARTLLVTPLFRRILAISDARPLALSSFLFLWFFFPDGC